MTLPSQSHWDQIFVHSDVWWEHYLRPLILSTAHSRWLHYCITILLGRCTALLLMMPSRVYYKKFERYVDLLSKTRITIITLQTNPNKSTDVLFKSASYWRTVTEQLLMYHVRFVDRLNMVRTAAACWGQLLELGWLTWAFACDVQIYRLIHSDTENRAGGWRPGRGIWVVQQVAGSVLNCLHP